MKKTSFVLIALLGLLSLSRGFSLPSYSASLNALDSALVEGDTLTLYGFIDFNEAEGETPLKVSDLYIKIEDSKLSGLQYTSKYSDSGNLLVDGLFQLSASTSSFVDGKTYSAYVYISGLDKENGVDKYIAKTTFTYSKSDLLKRNATLTTSFKYLNGGLDFNAKLENLNDIDVADYEITFSSRSSITGAETVIKTSAFGVIGAGNSSELNVEFEVPNEPRFIIVRASSDSVNSPQSKLFLIKLGLTQLDYSGELTISDCSIKEAKESYCEYTVENTGFYPATYTLDLGGVFSNAASQALTINPGKSATGKITITAVESERGDNSVTILLKASGRTVDQKTININVSPRDLVDKAEIRLKSFNSQILEGQGITINFTVSNTGDFPQNIAIHYILNNGEEVKYGNSFSLKEGQTVSKSISLTPYSLRGLTGRIGFEIRAVSENGTILGAVSSTFTIDEIKYSPRIEWTKGIIRAESGSESENYLTIINEGNVDDIYTVIVNSDYAKDIYIIPLSPNEEKIVKIPVVAKGRAGTYQITATACSKFSTECDSSDYNFIIYELPTFGNAEVLVNDTLKLEDGKAGIFEIVVKNNNGNSRTYSINVTGFDGEAKVTEAKTILSGESEKFLVYLLPTKAESQDVKYKVLENNIVIKEGNLSLLYGTGLLTGFVTAGSAGIAASVLGLALMAGLIMFGVRAFKQSKTELKYWK